MNYEDESYVRLYTRDTATWNLLEWQGQTVLMHMLRSGFDRAGIFDCDGRDPVRAIMAVTRLPTEVVEAGLAAVLREGVWTQRGGLLIWERYVYAQSCARTERARQRESRATRRDQALAGLSRSVTERHAPTQPVTPSQTKPNKTDPPISPEASRKKEKVREAIRKEPIPADFAPSESHRQQAAKLGVGLDQAVFEFVAFHEHQGTRSANWAAALRGWLSRAPRIAAQHERPSGVRNIRDDDARRLQRNHLLDEARDGRYGPLMQRRAIEALRTPGPASSDLADELERGQHARVGPRLAASS